MKKKFVYIIIVLLVLVVSQAVVASAKLEKSSNSKTVKFLISKREDQLIGVNITPINVKSNGTITATGYVQWYCRDCYPPGWQPAGGVEVHLDRVTSEGWYVLANGTTDANGYFSLQCQVPAAVGPYLYGVFVPAKGPDDGARLGPWIVTVYE